MNCKESQRRIFVAVSKLNETNVEQKGVTLEYARASAFFDANSAKSFKTDATSKINFSKIVHF